MKELRCRNRLQGVIIDDEFIEIKCGNNRCGAKSGVIVLHRFNIKTGKLVATNKFTDPTALREVNNGTGILRDSVRHPGHQVQGA